MIRMAGEIVSRIDEFSSEVSIPNDLSLHSYYDDAKEEAPHISCSHMTHGETAAQGIIAG